MKSLAILFLLFFFAACGKSGGANSDSNKIKVAEDLSSEIPSEALSFRINLGLKNFDAAQEDKVRRAADMVRDIIASREFREAVVNHTYDGKKTFLNNRGMTNSEIYQAILMGSETLLPWSNNAMDVDLRLYYENSSTIGYTYGSTTTIFMNTKYFDEFEPHQVAGNLMHEWVHKLGFTHSAQYSSTRRFSVPYALGYIIRNMAEEL